MKPSPVKKWWDEPWLEEEKHILDMRPADDETPPPPPTTTAADSEGEDDDDSNDDNEEEKDGGGGGGGDDGSGGVSTSAGREFAAALVSLAAREMRRERRTRSWSCQRSHRAAKLTKGPL